MGKEILGSLELNRIYQMDCLEGMKLIPDQSIDMILCDLPYGTTKCKWDVIIPFEQLWQQYQRVIKTNGAIVLTGSQPFTSLLVTSNLDWFKYEWVWQKTLFANFMHLKRQPAKKHENVLVFYKNQPTYNPQMEKGSPYQNTRKKREHKVEGTYGKVSDRSDVKNEGVRYPSSVQLFSNPNNNNVHPTQKPLALFEFLIGTYTNEGEVVLDNCMGSGTTAVAALKNSRKFIGFETESKYIEIANIRIESAYNKTDDERIMGGMNDE